MSFGDEMTAAHNSRLRGYLTALREITAPVTLPRESLKATVQRLVAESGVSLSESEGAVLAQTIKDLRRENAAQRRTIDDLVTFLRGASKQFQGAAQAAETK